MKLTPNKSIEIAEIKCTVVDAGGGRGFVTAISKKGDRLEIVGAIIEHKVEEVKRVTIEYVAPWTFTRSNGESLEMGGYHKLTGWF